MGVPVDIFTEFSILPEAKVEKRDMGACAYSDDNPQKKPFKKADLKSSYDPSA